mmetsp:Transcript_2079/g.5701  ORF Transcript_2079/g.5701 Transcript_2079/m.5701 type:complete len:252 (+) Transcript_2079:389-1144(+)
MPTRSVSHQGVSRQARRGCRPEAVRTVSASPTKLGRCHTPSSPSMTAPPRHAYLFLLQLSPDCTFLGCTPDQLFKLDGRHLTTDALAGTGPRGASQPEDDALAAELLGSEKDLREVYAVRDFLLRMLRDEFVHVRYSSPYVLQLRHVQHIAMQFTAKLRSFEESGVPVSGDKLLSAASSSMHLLHPTPAVCDVPTATARAAIANAEPFDRGLFAGPFGCVSAQSCEFCVAIRSALLDGSQTHLYAGAGVLR